MTDENLRLHDCKTPIILQSHQESAARGLVGLSFNPPPLSGTWVYFVGCAGFVKIGVTNNVPGRLSALRTASPFPVGLLGLVEGTAKDEADLHGYFKAKRVRGEWFALNEDDVLGILLACDYTALSNMRAVMALADQPQPREPYIPETGFSEGGV